MVGLHGGVQGDQLKGIGQFDQLWMCMVLNSETLEEGVVGAPGGGLSSAHPVQGSNPVNSSKTQPIVGKCRQCLEVVNFWTLL